MLKDFFITAHGWIQAETIEQAEEEYCETTGWVDSHIVEYLPTGERFDGREYSRAPLAFACSCAGCRQAPRCFENYRYWMRDALALVNGFYFADSTMKFFGCKVSHFYPFGEREGAVFFTTQKNGFDDFTRSRRWVVVCKFGEIVADSEDRKSVV